MTGWNTMSSAGSTSRMTAMLMSAPRLMSMHRLRMSSIFDTAATLAVAAKNVRPLVRMLGLHSSTVMRMASRTLSPRPSSRGSALW